MGKTISMTLDIQTKLSNLGSELTKVKKDLSELKAPTKLTNSLNDSFSELQDRVKLLKEQFRGNELDLIDEKKVKSEFADIEKEFKKLIGNISDNSGKFSLGNSEEEIEALTNAVKDYNKALSEAKTNIKDLKNQKKEKNSHLSGLKESDKKNTDRTAKIQKIEELLPSFKQARTRKDDKATEIRDKYTDKTTNQLVGKTENQVKSYIKSTKAYKDYSNKKGEIENLLNDLEIKVEIDSEEAEQEINNFKAKLEGEKNSIEVDIQADKRDLENITNQINQALKDLDELKPQALEKVVENLKEIQNSKKIDLGLGDLDKIDSIDILKDKIKELKSVTVEDVSNKLGDILKVLGDASAGVNDMDSSVEGTVKSFKEFNTESERIKDTVKDFFGLSNAAHLFQRAIESAYETVKSLDEVMTETAVVTDFSVGDMWDQLPEYTERANELGVSIQSVYESMAIFYQQGLGDTEAAALSTETLKMARIANLDAAEATDRMTNALRGFNMELNETNAQRVDDVYNKLAAISASDVDEISTAMTKVASLANSANMEFETTSAFLAQMIETTRESAETAGTALKTVVARFSEVKKLYSENELTGTDEEGEEIDVNKVSTALRTAGIDLNEYLTGAKGLDDIFMELAEKWDSLDIVQQRYIATMAAGSRQQSRFIAMMSDYERTVELVSAAENSEGAADEMFEKTMDSLESKLANLSNAWNTFILGLADSSTIKAAIDALTGLLTALERLTGFFGEGGSLAKIGLAVGGWKIGSGIAGEFVNNLISDFSSAFKGSAMKKAAEEAGEQFTEAVSESTGNGNNKNTGFIELAKKFNPKSAIDFYSNKIKANSAKRKSKGLLEEEEKALKELEEAQKKLDKAAEDREKYLNDAYSASDNGDESASYAKSQLLGARVEQAEIEANEAKKNAENASNKREENQEEGIEVDEVADKLRESDDFNTQLAGAAGTLALITGLIGEIAEATGNTKLAEWAEGATKGFEILAGALVLIPPLVKAISTTAGEALSGAMPWLAAIGAVAAVLVPLISSWAKANDQSLQVSTAMEQLSSDAESASEAFQTLSDSLDSLDGKYDTIDELTQGTKEWANAVQEVNSEILELIQRYPELSDFITSENGILTLDTDSTKVQKYLKRYENGAAEAENAEIAGNIRYAEVNQKENTYDALSEGLRDKTQTTNSLIEDKELGESSIYSLGKYIAEGKLTTFDEEALADINQYGISRLLINGSLTAAQAKEAYDYYKSINNIDSQIDTSFLGMAANTISGTGLTGTQANIATQFLTSDRMEDIFNEAYDGLEVTNANRAQLRKDYAKRNGYDTYALWKAANDGEDVDDETLRVSQASADATNTAEKSINTFASGLKNTSEAVQAVYEAADGGALKQEDLDAFKDVFTPEKLNKSWDEVKGDFSEDASDLIAESWASLGPEAREAYTGGFEQFAEDQFNAVKAATESYAEGDKNLMFESGMKVDQGLVNEAKNALGADAYEGLTSNIANVATGSGADAANSVMSAFNDALADVSEDDKDTFTEVLNGSDWYDTDALDGLKDTLKELGIVVEDTKIDTLVEQIKEATNAAHNFTEEQLAEKLNDLNSVASKLQSDSSNRSFSEDEYNALISADSSLKSSFIQDLDGNYKYLGTSMQALTTAVQEATAALIDEKIDRYRNQISAGETMKGLVEEGGGLSSLNWGNLDEWNSASLHGTFTTLKWAAERDGWDLSSLGIDGVSNNTQSDDLDDDKLLEVIKAAYSLYGNLNGLIADEHQFEVDQKATQYSGLDPTQIAAKLIGNSNEGLTLSEVEIEGAVKALKSKLYDSGYANAEEYIKGFEAAMESGDEETKAAMYNEIASLSQDAARATEAGLDMSALQVLADTYEKAGVDAATAYNMAVNRTISEQAGESITSNSSSWDKLVKSGDDVQEASGKASYIENLASLMNITSEAATDLFNSFEDVTEACDLIKKAAKGDEKAIATLRKAFLKTNGVVDQYIKQMEEAGISNSDSFKNAIQDLQDYNGELQNINLSSTEGIGQNLYDTFFGFYQLARQVMNMSVEDANQYAQNMTTAFGGIECPEFEVEEVEATTGATSVEFTPGQIVDTGQGVYKSADAELSTEETQTPFTVLKMKGDGSTTSLQRNKVGNTGTSGGGGGGGKKTWKNPYDKLYNKTEELDEATRQREKLEREYNRLLEDRLTTSDQLIEKSLEEIANLRKQEDIQNELIAGRKEQIKNIGQETYLDSDNKEVSFNEAGVTKYATYDFATGTIKLDWDAINAVKDEDEGKAIEEYVKKLEELVGELEDAEDQRDEINDQITEIKNQNKENYIEFEQRIYDALVDQEQKRIDELEDYSDTLEDTNSKILDELQQSIELSRQIRDNTKKEEDIADMEQRLAYLRRDTSNANQTEILALEKELEDAREEYQDELIDQKLDQLSEDNDDAAEQRQRQIEIQQEILDNAVENGEYWPQVYALIESSFNEDSSLKMDSELVKILEESDTFKGLSYFGKENWINEMAQEWLQAAEGQNYWKTEEAEKSGKITLGSGENANTVTYDEKTKSWSDSSGNKYDIDTLKYNGSDNTFSMDKIEEEEEEETSTIPSNMRPSLISGDLSYSGKYGGENVMILQRALKALGYNVGKYGKNKDGIDGYFGSVTKKALLSFQKDAGITQSGKLDDATKKAFGLKGYATGGLADFTGPAWLDGTKSKPEMVLSSTDTENFIALKEILSQFLKNGSNNSDASSSGDNYFDISIEADIGSDYDVDQLAERIKKQITEDSLYRNVNAINWIR